MWQLLIFKKSNRSRLEISANPQPWALMVHAVSLAKDVASASVPDLDLMQRLPHSLYPVALYAISSVCKRPTPRTQGLGKSPFTLGDIAGQIDSY